jgi:hypothetical protein
MMGKENGGLDNELAATERAWISKPNYYFLNYSWYKPEFINYK